jgi:hypothetical protein
MQLRKVAHRYQLLVSVYETEKRRTKQVMVGSTDAINPQVPDDIEAAIRDAIKPYASNKDDLDTKTFVELKALKQKIATLQQKLKAEGYSSTLQQLPKELKQATSAIDSGIEITTKHAASIFSEMDKLASTMTKAGYEK